MIIKKIYNGLINSIRGLWFAYKWDKSFRIEVWFGLFFILFGFLMWPLTKTEFVLLSLSYLLILTTELINTSLEKILEKVHPEFDEAVGMGKDIASAAVLMTIIFAIIVMITIFISHNGLQNLSPYMARGL